MTTELNQFCHRLVARENLTLLHVNNTEQPAHSHSLIRAFDIHFLEV